MPRTYKWTQLSGSQQDAARRVWELMRDAGWGVTVSQLGKHLDEAMAYRRGDLPAAELAALCGGVRLPGDP